MATPNYSYEKRQRELAKKKKAEEKRLRKLSGKPDDAPDEGNGETSEAPAEGTDTSQDTPPAA